MFLAKALSRKVSDMYCKSDGLSENYQNLDAKSVEYFELDCDDKTQFY